MKLTLSDEARRIAGLVEEETGVTVRDCVVDDAHDQILVVVKTGEMARAIGRDGEQVRNLEKRIGSAIKLVEDADHPNDFVANALAPAAVYEVTIEQGDETRATVEVAEQDRGVAIGADGKNIAAARRLVSRHHDIDHIELTE